MYPPIRHNNQTYYVVIRPTPKTDQKLTMTARTGPPALSGLPYGSTDVFATKMEICRQCDGLGESHSSLNNRSTIYRWATLRWKWFLCSKKKITTSDYIAVCVKYPPYKIKTCCECAGTGMPTLTLKELE